MNQVAKFINGSFATVGEGLWRDVSGNYFVGGEMSLPTERVQQMDTAGELEWLSGEGLEVLPAAAPAPVLAPVPEERTSEIVAGDAGQAPPSAEQKKSPWPWIAACVALLVVGAVTVVFILNQPEPAEQIAGTSPVEYTSVELESESDEPEMLEQTESLGNIVTFDEGWTGITFDYNADLLELSMFEPEILASIDTRSMVVSIWTDYDPIPTSKDEFLEIWLEDFAMLTVEHSEMSADSLEIISSSQTGEVFHSIFWGFYFDSDLGLWYSELSMVYPVAERSIWDVEANRIATSLRW